MTGPRTQRGADSREKEQRLVYQPASMLPEPDQDPAYVYRWVATHVMGVLDPMNASKRFRDGWEPVKAEDHPELMLPGLTQGNVEVGGLMLCRMPREKGEARKRFYEQQNEMQVRSVDNTFMRENNSKMPLFSEKSSEVTRGRGFGKGS